MTPVQTIKNQYRGINAHLHSLWQSEGGWDAFHSVHITYLTAALKAQLLPMGYTAENQQSLQIRRFGEPAGKPESDVTIYDRTPLHQSASVPALSSGAYPLLPIPTVMTIEDELAQYDAIAIYAFDSAQSSRGEPVAWVELLSPSNKPGGQDAAYYRSKRLKLLHSGIVFVELDYLHESPPTFDRIARYTGKQQTPFPTPGAHPYRIMVIDPRPVFSDGRAAHAPFDVDAPIPTVSIPLNRGDVLSFDFNVPYQKTYQELLYGLELVDYSHLPVHFERYSTDDQQRIVERLIAVFKARQDGLDLEMGGFPTEPITLREGLELLQGLWP
jgi:hypothetical protein